MNMFTDDNSGTTILSANTMQGVERRRHLLYVRFAVLLLAVVFGGIVYFVYDSRSPGQPLSTTSEGLVKTNDAIVTIDISDAGYTPNTVQIAKNTTVSWNNTSSLGGELKSDVLPDLGGQIVLLPGDTYSYTFETPGTYTYYVGDDPTVAGTIVVTE